MSASDIVVDFFPGNFPWRDEHITNSVLIFSPSYITTQVWNARAFERFPPTFETFSTVRVCAEVFRGSLFRRVGKTHCGPDAVWSCFIVPLFLKCGIVCVLFFGGFVRGVGGCPRRGETRDCQWRPAHFPPVIGPNITPAHAHPPPVSKTKENWNCNRRRWRRALFKIPPNPRIPCKITKKIVVLSRTIVDGLVAAAQTF